jgi:hypothetical protein
MAVNVLPGREQPKFIVVSRYAVNRIGLYPEVQLSFTECVYMLDTTVTVASAQDADADGKYEVFVLPGLSLATDNPVGRMLAKADSSPLGKITAATDVEITPAGTDGNGNPVPAVTGVQVTIAADTAPSTNPAATEVALAKRMPVGTPAYRPADGGKTWDFVLAGANPLAMSRLTSILGTAHVASTLAALQALAAAGNGSVTVASVTSTQVASAVGALGAAGTNIDGILAEQGEQLLEDWAAGNAEWVQVFGNPPRL